MSRVHHVIRPMHSGGTAMATAFAFRAATTRKERTMYPLPPKIQDEVVLLMGAAILTTLVLGVWIL